ncbi:hypothetical protein [Halorubrum trapanicum]|uniref:hypothetical protein n=1 Tax=Halorubrum trapanicum TaxID=29284 RepID=UPI003C6EAD2C
MERRKFVVGLGALASGSAAAMGTGAFSSVSADRDVAVSVADDNDAFLSLSPSDGPNSAYAQETDGMLEIAFDGSISDQSGPNGTGINDQATTIIRDVFDIQNQGTQDVYIWVNGLKEPSDSTGIDMYTDGPANGSASDGTLNGNDPDIDNGNAAPLANYLKLEPGDTMEEVGFAFYNFDGSSFDFSDFDDEITIVAKADSEL